MIAKLIYNILVYPLLSFGAHAAALFSRKMRTGISGRRKVASEARAFRNKHPNARVVLFHCASAGELEGVKPLAALCRKDGYSPCVMYFSPSAAGVVGETNFDFAGFSPFDSRRHVRDFLQALRPETVLITKHDVWPNMVWQCDALRIPAWLINGNFRGGSFKHWPGAQGFLRSIYSRLTGILAVSEDHAARARELVGDKTVVSSVGDSRFDRVWARAQEKRDPLAEFSALLSQREWLIGGSTHTRDEELLLGSLGKLRKQNSNIALLLVPHDPSEDALKRIVALAETHSLSCAEISSAADAPDVLIVNRNRILADVYRYGVLAYVGGGFDRGVHSVIEPMAHGLAVLCGPNIDVSREAQDSQHENLLRVVHSADDVPESATLLSSIPSQIVRTFVEQRANVAERVLKTVLRASDAA